MKMFALSLFPVLFAVTNTLAAPNKQIAENLVTQSGVKGGIIVHVGCDDGKLTTALRLNEAFQVQGLDTDAAEIETARAFAQAKGIYGPVSFSTFTGDHLPYIDNFVNLLLVEEGAFSPEEINRVLAPLGAAMIKKGINWETTKKAWPDSIDEWTHYLHDAGGNAVAEDTEVSPPKHMQWLGSPRWSRHHDRMASMSAMVSAEGRVFYIMDEGSRISIQMPSRWKLVARDAFNGTILWKKDIEDWMHHLWPLKSGPTLLARRLVASGDRVYVTLGINAPVKVMDAATGEELHDLENSGGADEVILSGEHVYSVVNPGQGLAELAHYAPKLNTGDQGRVGKEYKWDEKPRKVMAFVADTGSQLWSKESVVAPMTLASDANGVYFHDGEKVICVDPETGEQKWTTEAISRKSSITFNFGPKLVAHGDVLIVAGGNRSMTAIDLKTGKTLWSAPHERGGYQSPEDLLIVNDLVWSAPTTGGNDSGEFKGRDLKTGEVKVSFPPDVSTYWFHHRCYIAKATTNFLMPSRTGIEFVDYKNEDWTINHWVRGGCLYGVLPCNGLTYAPPHNCACYPEAKLYGLNALAGASTTRPVPGVISDEGRLEKGPVYGAVATPLQGGGETWPTYRHDNARSGSITTPLAARPAIDWTVTLGGRLTALTAAEQMVFVAQIDQHTLHGLDEATGEKRWSYTAGGRIDSPPTYYQGHLLFGSADGYVYSLRAADGAVAWRFRAAPEDRRHAAFEQIESVWPVHGNILVEDGMAYFVAGRSYFLDGGLRWFKMNPLTGEKLAEIIMDDKDPEGEALQDRIQTLQMPVGLPDILSSDSKWIYMRSQRFDTDGKRYDLGPHSGTTSVQGGNQGGETAHLFSPTGFLDGSWFHRSYWVYGRSFAGGHNGYHQAGKFAPSGRIICFNKDRVYGFARKPEYYRWTTTLEHHLFAADRVLPEIQGNLSEDKSKRRGQVAGNSISFPVNAALDPTGKPVALEAWIHPAKPNGVIVSRGGPAEGYALFLKEGQPWFAVRANKLLAEIQGDAKVPAGRWTHIMGVLAEDKSMKLFVNGQMVASGQATGLLASDPVQTLDIGSDLLSGVSEQYKSPAPYAGLIDNVRVYHTPLSAADLDGLTRMETPKAPPVLVCTFDGKALERDTSSHKNKGALAGAVAEPGKFGRAASFKGIVAKAAPKKKADDNVKHFWNQDIPLFARAMLLADKILFVAGPPDLIDEEETFVRLSKRDETVEADLARQDEALDGKQGAVFYAARIEDGSMIATMKLPSLPVWDGMAAAYGKMYMATEKGEVICLK
ncbi:MAG: outer membrane protein assembly factor BamB [Kiritimatiellia bacterium]|jgi:outer membrane protein assembly factor BamB